MGMFNYLICKYPRPHLDAKEEPVIYQTKSINPNLLDTYIIDYEGNLLHQDYLVEEVPEEEKDPVWGLPFWSHKPTTQSFFPYTGQIKFYTHDEQSQWIEYTSSFEKGKLASLERVS